MSSRHRVAGWNSVLNQIHWFHRLSNEIQLRLEDWFQRTLQLSNSKGTWFHTIVSRGAGLEKHKENNVSLGYSLG